jgi:hypothetical protein
VSFKQRLRRLLEKAVEGGVVVRQRDGTLRRFDTMEVQAQMFLARMDLWRDTATDSEVVRAVRNATPESRAAFEEKFGAIVMTNYVIASRQKGGWVEAKTLTEDGRVERVRYEGGSPEATLIREKLSSESPHDLHEELPRPPVAGRWVDEPDEDMSSLEDAISGKQKAEH